MRYYKYVGQDQYGKSKVCLIKADTIRIAQEILVREKFDILQCTMKEIEFNKEGIMVLSN